MGIVFGDIGTSPLYTLQVTVKAASPSGMITSAAVLGDRIIDLLVADRRE
jgi:K+ transporter